MAAASEGQAKGRGTYAGSPPRDVHEQPPRQHEIQKVADGLDLHLSPTSATGYRGVRRTSGGRFQAYVWGAEGDSRSLGCFDTAVEAAYAFAWQMQWDAQRELRRRLNAGLDGVAASSSQAAAAAASADDDALGLQPSKAIKSPPPSPPVNTETRWVIFEPPKLKTPDSDE